MASDCFFYEIIFPKCSSSSVNAILSHYGLRFIDISKTEYGVSFSLYEQIPVDEMLSLVETNCIVIVSNMDLSFMEFCVRNDFEIISNAYNSDNILDEALFYLDDITDLDDEVKLKESFLKNRTFIYEKIKTRIISEYDLDWIVYG